MLNYAPLDKPFSNTNSLLPVMDFLFNSSNETTRDKSELIINDAEKTTLVKLDNLISSFHYEHAFGKIFISNHKRLTQEINDLILAQHTNIYSFLERKIKSFASKSHLQSDLSISQEAVDEACYFFKKNVEFNGLTPPKIKVIPMDEINFNWDNKSIYLDLAIVGDSTYSFYMKDKLTGEELCYDVGITDRLPNFIVKKLSGENVWE